MDNYMPDTLPNWTWDLLPDWEYTVLQSFVVELGRHGYNSRLRSPDTRILADSFVIEYGIDIWRTIKWYNPKTWLLPLVLAKICCVDNMLYVELAKSKRFLRVDLFDPNSIDSVMQFVKQAGLEYQGSDSVLQVEGDGFDSVRSINRN